ncbi:GGDEF domain-containing protein [Stenotrophomonas sp. SY1]|uniref:GGDEF domain-containing protein n=1 Tax=Stenotrophomonas sp. SY1 TaxID=477235 RepID=UPI001E2FE88E|nr:GGDEF domain-containing protein [Stenotrophomonas sp. SY1]MCD9086433.1 GGDEF domain-containing protein [Stenotrophomonas sp. SY1]
MATSSAWARTQASSAGVSSNVGWIVACVLLLLGLLLCLWLLWRQRARSRQLSLHAQEQTRLAQRQAEVLEAVSRESATLEQQLREQVQAFERLANEDDLSGLPNRRAFDDALARNMAAAHRDGRPLSLIVLSIDHLKQINASWSRAVGDLVLCETGELLRRGLRASDMPARLGNKEFAVLLSNATLADAERVGERLQLLFAQFGQWGGRSEGGVTVTFSAGAVQMDLEDLAPVQFYQRAKSALARAKHEGRARTCTG